MYGTNIVLTFNLNNKTIAFKKFECGYCRNATKCKTFENCSLQSYISQRADNLAISRAEKSLKIMFNARSVEELTHAYQTAKRAIRLRAIPQPKIK